MAWVTGFQFHHLIPLILHLTLYSVCYCHHFHHLLHFRYQLFLFHCCNFQSICTDQCILAPKFNIDTYLRKLIFNIRTTSVQALIRRQACLPSIEFLKIISQKPPMTRWRSMSGLASKACLHT